MRKIFLIFFVIVAFCFLVAARPMLIIRTLNWWVSGPSSQTLHSGDYQLIGMVGQGVVANVTKTGDELCSGFLCYGEKSLRTFYLPMFYR